MSLPRCGVKDKVGSGSDSRSKRYALQGNQKFISIKTPLVYTCKYLKKLETWILHGPKKN